MDRRNYSPCKAQGRLSYEIWQDGKLVEKHQMKNLVTLSGMNLIRDLLGQQPGAAGISYFALGTGTLVPSLATTKLTSEAFRDLVTRLWPDSGKLQVQYYLAPNACNGLTLTEAACFGGAASGTADSGSIYACAPIEPAIVKNDSIAVTFSWECDWGGVS